MGGGGSQDITDGAPGGEKEKNFSFTFTRVLIRRVGSRPTGFFLMASHVFAPPPSRPSHEWLALKSSILRADTQAQPRPPAQPASTNATYLARKLERVAQDSHASRAPMRKRHSSEATLDQQAASILSRLPLGTHFEQHDVEGMLTSNEREALQRKLQLLEASYRLRCKTNAAAARARDADPHSATILYASLLQAPPPMPARGTAPDFSASHSTLLSQMRELLERYACVMGREDAGASPGEASELLSLHQLLSASREARAAAGAAGFGGNECAGSHAGEPNCPDAATPHGGEGPSACGISPEGAPPRTEMGEQTQKATGQHDNTSAAAELGEEGALVRAGLMSSPVQSSPVKEEGAVALVRAGLICSRAALQAAEHLLGESSDMDDDSDASSCSSA